jgi:predicted glycogen debranching enzyme
MTAESHEPLQPDAALAAEQQRQREVCGRFWRVHPGAAASADLAMLSRLALAADQYLVDRRDEQGMTLGTTVIAGYPWFSDWGRDTMIALPGLTLATGRSELAASILRTFARFVSQGMVPNRFPDTGDVPEYNTADASLWLFIAVHQYLRANDDKVFAADIYPILRDMINWHIRGTRFGIRMDAEDALLRAGEAGVQLTWMDAKVGDWVVTPRIGKPVEINALWFNAASIMRDLAGELDRSQDQAEYAALAARIGTSFDSRFWFEEGGYLYDVIDGPEGELDSNGRRQDRSLRPNQVFALSLPFALLSGERARRTLQRCAAELWTPVGLRSLAPGDARYAAHYGGGPLERDGAYHQGTVWTWLLGPFATAHYRVHADAEAALDWLRGIVPHLREGCVGQISEIMDAAAPFEPRGCFAQAWGVAEILRAWSEISGSQSRVEESTTVVSTERRAVTGR